MEKGDVGSVLSLSLSLVEDANRYLRINPLDDDSDDSDVVDDDDVDVVVVSILVVVVVLMVSYPMVNPLAALTTICMLRLEVVKRVGQCSRMPGMGPAVSTI